MKIIRNVCVGIVWSCLVACSSVDIDVYDDIKPSFNVESFFNGQLKAYGIVKNREGKMIRHFTADIDASWENGIGTLDEVFLFDDGERQVRTWTLVADASTPNTYSATAGDVIGAATMETAGNALFLEYVLRLPYKQGTIDVTVDDRMYLVTPTTLINESALYKFGFNVGEVVLTIQKISN